MTCFKDGQWFANRVDTLRASLLYMVSRSESETRGKALMALFHSIRLPVRFGSDARDGCPTPPEMEWKGLVRTTSDALSDVRPFVSQRQNESDVQLINQWSSTEYLAMFTRFWSHTRIIGSPTVSYNYTNQWPLYHCTNTGKMLLCCSWHVAEKLKAWCPCVIFSTFRALKWHHPVSGEFLPPPKSFRPTYSIDPNRPPMEMSTNYGDHYKRFRFVAEMPPVSD